MGPYQKSEVICIFILCVLYYTAEQQYQEQRAAELRCYHPMISVLWFGVFAPARTYMLKFEFASCIIAELRATWWEDSSEWEEGEETEKGRRRKGGEEEMRKGKATAPTVATAASL